MTSRRLLPGSEVTVHGTWFHHGCADGSGDLEVPMTGVPLQVVRVRDALPGTAAPPA